MAAKKFTHSRPFSKRQTENTPADKPAVYELLNRAGDIIYAGVAQRNRLPDRLAEHLPGEKDAIPGAAAFRYKQKGSIEQAKREEKRIINKEEPKHNEER